MSSRAQLLSGLRTGGPRASSPFESDFAAQQQQQFFANQMQGGSPLPAGMLKANAAVFTPGGRTTTSSPGGGSQSFGGEQAAAEQQINDVQTQLAALRLQNITNDGQGGNLAALYGAAQGQPHSQDLTQLLQQRQLQHAQMLQNQLLKQQQQQQQQQQLELLRQEQQQRMLLAHMQAEQERQAQQQIFSAHEQRQAAQASIQASLRQRQMQQRYAQLVEQQQAEEELQQQQQQQLLLQRIHYLQQLQSMTAASQEEVPKPQESYRRASPPTTRSDSPSNNNSSSNTKANDNRRQRQASAAAADAAVSWRSQSTSFSRNQTPSIVVDDSESEKSEGARSSGSDGGEDESPETSEEDICATNATIASGKPRLAGLDSLRKMPLQPTPRAISIREAPRTRAFAAESKATQGNGTASSESALIQPMRQPRGPPTEFQAHNFATRINARTRREAMSKLCASPRAASFTVARPSTTVV